MANDKPLTVFFLSGDSRIQNQEEESIFAETLSHISENLESAVVFASFPPSKSYTQKNIQVIGMGSSVLSQLLFLATKFPFLLKTDKPDLIVAHGYGFFHLPYIGKLWSKIFSIPLLVDLFHIDGYPIITQKLDHFSNFFVWFFLKYFGRNTHFRVMHLIQIPNLLDSLGIPRSQIHVLSAIYVDPKIFQPKKTKKIYDLIWVARLEKNKGLDVFLESLKRVSKKHKIKVCIVGNGQLQSELETFIEKDNRNLTIDYISFLNSKQDLIDTIQASKIFVCTSLIEGGPRTVVEAMALGIPVISSEVGIVPEIITDGNNGLLFNGSPKDLAVKTIELLADKKQRDLLAKQGHKTSLAFSKADHYQNYSNLYQEIAQK